MKWGKKKPLASFSSTSSLPHCSQPSSLISHVFPVSWLSKLKHKNSGNSEPNPRKLNHPKGKWNSLLVNSPKCASFVADYGNGHGNGNGNGKFYGFDDDGDAFWRLSFGPDNAEEKSKSVGFDSDDQQKVPVFSCPNCRKEETVLRSPRSAKTAVKLRSRSRRELVYGEKRSACGYVSPSQTAATSPGLRIIEEQRKDLKTKEEISEEQMSLTWPSLKELDERKSLYVSMEKQRKRTTKQTNNYNNRVRAYSPRAETCKVKALEDMKKTKLKMKTKKKRKETKTGLASFAVVKSSYDPQKDFKESMVEMILEKKMSRPEELEELLACYLTLNSDDHHDLIIKVFREVWLELDRSQSEQVFSD